MQHRHPFGLTLVGLVGFLFSVNTTLHAFSGTEGASFLDIPVGARGAAMGSAYTALASDAYAPTVNPGGLGFLETAEASGMHVPYVVDTAYEYASFVYPINDNKGIGAAMQYFRPGDLAGTDITGQSIGGIGGYYAAGSLSYGQRFGDKWSLGATGKFVRGKIDDVSATALAAELGTLVQVTPTLRLAAVVDNIGQKMKFLQDSDSLPLTTHLGAAYKFMKPLTASVEVVHLNDGTNGFRTGAEWRNAQGFSIRGGYNSQQGRQLSGLAGLSLGLGLTAWGTEFAYAWTPLGDLGSSHYLALILRFGKTHTSMEGNEFLQYIPTRRISSLLDQSNDDDMENLDMDLGN